MVKPKTETNKAKCSKEAATTVKEPRFFCGVCLAPFTRHARAPISLNCGHVFCASCVPQMYKRDNKEDENNEGQQAEGASTANKLLIRCGTCRAITYSKANQLKKCVMLAELMEKEGQIAESEDDDEIKGEQEEEENTPAGRMMDELNTFYRHTSQNILREEVFRIVTLANSMRTGASQRFLQGIEEMEHLHTNFEDLTIETINLPFPDYARETEGHVNGLTVIFDRIRVMEAERAAAAADEGNRSRQRQRAPSPEEQKEEGGNMRCHETQAERRRRREERAANR